jgi:glutathione synthase/RimK-type ligase-like ATP-grasp enzyme
MRIAIASCKQLPEPDHDEALLLAALREAGVDAAVLAWDDDAAPFAGHDVVVLRSTWNYYERVDDFVAWAERTGAATKVLNAPSIVAWNAKKTYLAELERRGVPTVPTEFVMRGASTRRSVSELLAERGWDEVVIKPVVSAGSFRTERFARASAQSAQAFLDALVRDRDAMVQRWMPSVETYGERSLVWIDGAITHAIRKSPRFAGGVEQVSGEIAIADDERAFAERAVAPFASELLYARIDMVRDADGTLRVMELELIEPSLFFQHYPRALQRFVKALVRRAGATSAQ